MTRPVLDRRQLFQTAGIAVTAAALPWRTARAQTGALVPPTLVVMLIDRGTDGTSAVARDAALAALAARGLPAGLASVRAASPPRQTPGPTLEPALWDDSAVTLPRYFQARTLSEKRAAWGAIPASGRPPLALVAPDPIEALTLSGLSPAGVRCAFLVPDASAPSWIESHPARVVAARGGHLARIDEATGADAAFDAAQAYLQEAAGDPKQTHATLYLDLKGPPDAVAALAESLAAEIDSRVQLGHLVPLAPGEIGARHAQGFERVIGLRLDPPSGGRADDPALTGLVAALEEAGIAFSVARDDPASLGPADCWRTTASALRAEGVPDPVRGHVCALIAPPDPAAAPLLAAAGIEAAMGAGDHGFRGLDGNALLHLDPVIEAASAEEIDALPARLGLCEDAVLAIDTGALALPVRRNTVLAALRRIGALAGTRIVDLAEFTRLVGARDPVLATLHRTRAMAQEIGARTEDTRRAADRAALMADARRAWAYFEAVTHENTGLPDTTVAFEPDGTPGSRNEMLTQWDTGSAILGWIAALRLGIIDRERFDAWSRKAIAALATTTLPQPRLPRAIFYAGAPWRGSADFNICDAGRLLVALKALDNMTPGGNPELRALVAGWDLAEMVIDGVPHSREAGVPVAGPDAHCTGYIKRALALWGITATSQYDVYHLGQTEADAAMALLDEAARIGTLGAEPLLQEALELGYDAPGRVLRDVLLAEQIATWRATGTLIAPSEGPIDRPPWFTYQGLRIDREGPARWDVFTLTPGGDTPTEAFRTAARMLTCKAPFLWAAAHPHPYCDQLVAHVRERGQMVSGYVSGIYSETDAPTVDYGDVNTNGVILEAVAALLGMPIRA